MENHQKSEEIKSKWKNWLYDHLWVKNSLDYSWTFIICTLSALVFCVGFNAFMDVAGEEKLVAGGVSGMSQNIAIFLELFGWNKGFTEAEAITNEKLLESILYFVINIPLIILAWLKIGKKFTIFTLINVAEVSLFIVLLNGVNVPFIEYIANYVSQPELGGLLARALFAGVCTGLSSALAFKVDISAGGIDIIAYYIALRKNTLVGKYSVIINSITVLAFAVLTSAKVGWDNEVKVAEAFSKILYSGIYMLAGMFVVDGINVRNKKMKVEVISSNKDLGDLLVASIPHGATMTTGVGVYTGKERYIFTMVVSSYELNDLLKLVERQDPSSFIQVVQLHQVVGRFYVKPVK